MHLPSVQVEYSFTSSSLHFGSLPFVSMRDVNIHLSKVFVFLRDFSYGSLRDLWFVYSCKNEAHFFQLANLTSMVFTLTGLHMCNHEGASDECMIFLLIVTAVTKIPGLFIPHRLKR